MTETILLRQKRAEHLKRSRFRFWMPVLLMAAGMSLLWSMVPYALILKPPRASNPNRPARGPAAAYVELEPAYAAQAFKKIRSAWASDAQNGKLSLEMGLVDLERPLPEPWYLEEGSLYPGKWSPAPPQPLPQPPPPIIPPALPIPDVTFPPPVSGVRHTLSADLKRAGFTFTPPELPLPEANGNGIFEVETDETGRVIHLLLLTKRTPSLARIEQAIFRGTAQSAAIGQITCEWQN